MFAKIVWVLASEWRSLRRLGKLKNAGGLFALSQTALALDSVRLAAKKLDQHLSNAPETSPTICHQMNVSITGRRQCFMLINRAAQVTMVCRSSAAQHCSIADLPMFGHAICHVSRRHYGQSMRHTSLDKPVVRAQTETGFAHCQDVHSMRDSTLLVWGEKVLRSRANLTDQLTQQLSILLRSSAAVFHTASPLTAAEHRAPSHALCTQGRRPAVRSHNPPDHCGLCQCAAAVGGCRATRLMTGPHCRPALRPAARQPQ